MKIEDLFERDDILLEMPKIENSITGINYPIWIFKVGGQHAFRLKIGNHHYTKTSKADCFILDISKDPKIPKGSTLMKTEDLANVKKWISFNYETLVKMSKCLELENGDEYYRLEKTLTPLTKVLQIEKEKKRKRENEFN